MKSSSRSSLKNQEVSFWHPCPSCLKFVVKLYLILFRECNYGQRRYKARSELKNFTRKRVEVFFMFLIYFSRRWIKRSYVSIKTLMKSLVYHICMNIKKLHMHRNLNMKSLVDMHNIYSICMYILCMHNIYYMHVFLCLIARFRYEMNKNNH